MSAGKTILVIEDERSLNRALKSKLTHEGFDVLTAKNGEDGINVALDAKPDLILLDIVMPVMDGMTMLNELRQDTWGKDVPVIMLTNLNSRDQVASALELDTYDYFVKADCKLEEVVAKVKERLNIS